MSTPDPRREHEPTMDGDDDLQAGHYDAGQNSDSAGGDDPTRPQPDDEQPPSAE